VAAFVGISGCSSSDGTEPGGTSDEWAASGGSDSTGVGGSGSWSSDQPVGDSAGGTAPDGGLFHDALGIWDAAKTVAGSACQQEMQEPEPYDVVLMLVVDVSGSMTQPIPGTNLTKWDVTREALRAVVQGLPPDVAMGAVYFPNLDPPPMPHQTPTEDLSECVNTGAMVEPAVLDVGHRDRLEASLDSVVVAGGTPTHSAYQVGLEALKKVRLPGNKYMLLITDGEPTYGVGCVGNGTTLKSNIKPEYITDTLDLVEATAKASPPIGTFVIGSPGSELLYSGADARPWLSEAAALGNTAPRGCSHEGPNFCHFDLTDSATNFSAGLNNALAQILGQVVACDYFPPVPRAVPSSISVESTSSSSTEQPRNTWCPEPASARAISAATAGI